jgi:hypothetical protein
VSAKLVDNIEDRRVLPVRLDDSEVLAAYVAHRRLGFPIRLAKPSTRTGNRVRRLSGEAGSGTVSVPLRILVRVDFALSVPAGRWMPRLTRPAASS